MKRKQHKEKEAMNEKQEIENQQEQLNNEGNTADNTAEASVDVADNETQTEDMSVKITELNEKYLRLYSDFDNFRKRSIKERIEFSKTASEDIITALLPVIDDFDRALKAIPGNTEHDPFTEGIRLIFSKFSNILAQKGVEEIKAIGEPFNTDFHEAVTRIHIEDEEMNGKIIDEIQKGYMLNGKVIRFSKVVVGMKE